MNEEYLYYDDETMDLVAGALIKSGLDDDQVRNAINEMQNAGILFRERRSENQGSGN